MIWDWALRLDILPQMAEASLVTLRITVMGFAVAAVGGPSLAVLANARDSGDQLRGAAVRGCSCAAHRC